jgi:hypothetical protein
VSSVLSLKTPVVFIKPFYITSSRYRSMVTDYVTPMDKTYSVLGQPKFSLQQGVNETLTWLHTQPEFHPTPLSSPTDPCPTP